MHKQVEKLINWRELGKLLFENDGRDYKKSPLRSKTVPKRYSGKVKKLEYYITSWLNEEELITKKEANKLVEDKIKEIKAKINHLYKDV